MHSPDPPSKTRRNFRTAFEEWTCKALLRTEHSTAKGAGLRIPAQLQKQRWFNQAQRWRAGIESRMATLKHRFNMGRAVYKGDRGFQRHVGWSVIANNLVNIARARQIRKEQQDADVHQAA